MFLSKRNGIYYVWTNDAHGKRKKVSTGTKNKSEALLYLKKIFNDEHVTITNGPLLSAFIIQLFEYITSNMTSGTLRIYQCAFNHFIEFNGDLHLNKITAYHFDHYKICRLKQVGPVTVNTELRSLKAGFSVAKRWQLVDKNPFDGLPFVAVPEHEPVYFAKNDFYRLLSLIKEDWLRRVVLFSALTGMRQGEVLSLRWGQVDLSRGTVKIESSKVFRTKSGKRRTLPLSRAAETLLRSIEIGDSNALVFTLHGQSVKSRWVGVKMRYYIRKFGFNRELNYHSLRHSFASWLAMDGASIYQISKLLGHSDVSVTQDFYAHLQPDSLRDVVNMINMN